MNLVRVMPQELRFVEKSEVSLEVLIEFFADNYYDLLYITHGGCLVDILSAHDITDYLLGTEGPLVNRPYVWALDKMPVTADIQHRFESQEMPDHVAILVRGQVVCEIKNVAGLNESRGLYKSQMALRILPLFENRCRHWAERCGYRRALVIAKRELWEIIRLHITWMELIFVESVNREYSLQGADIVVDCRYFSLRRYLDFRVITISLFDILEEIALDALIENCSHRGVSLFLFRIPMEGSVTKLSLLERTQATTHVNIRDLIHDKRYMDSYCPSERERRYLMSNSYCDTALIDDDGLTVQENTDGEELKVYDGVRNTVPENVVASHEWHLFGTCTMFGFCTPDDLTIPSFLQTKLLANHVDGRVVNHACLQGRFLLNTLLRALTTPIRAGDCIVLLDYFDDEMIARHREIIDTARWFNKEKTSNDHWFLDYPMHCNSIANKMLSEQIYGYVVASRKSLFAIDAKTPRVAFYVLPKVSVKELKVTNAAMYQHIRHLKRYRNGHENNGLVIVYASPFTFGHRYLVEQALSQSDYVFVFVISEYFHGYSTLDRLDMVRKGLSDLDRVFVMPSEIYFASKQYFPAYGNRQSGIGDIARLTYQEEMVVKCLCPELGITKRFLGEENGDAVTNLYNRIVIETCQEAGIDCIVVPRIKADGKEISAKLFRASMSAGRLGEAYRFAPESTIEHIRQNCECTYDQKKMH